MSWMDSATWRMWEGGNLLAALVLPLINKDEVEYKGVTPLVDDARIITYGDVIVNQEHAAFEIYMRLISSLMAWRQIDFAKEQLKQILAGENGQKYGNEVTEAAEREAKINDLIGDFHSRIEGLRRDGVPDYPSPGRSAARGPDAAEERKLENIVWESMAVGLDNGGPINVPGMIRVEAVERNVDYARLPEAAVPVMPLKSLACRGGRAKDPDHHAAASLEKIAGLEYDASGHDYQEDLEHPDRQASSSPSSPIPWKNYKRTINRASYADDTGPD